NRKETVCGGFHVLLSFFEGRMVYAYFIVRRLCQVITYGVRYNEVTICQTLHQGRSTEAVSTVVREVTLARCVQTWDVGHQVVVYPKATHGVVHGRVDAHWFFIW